MTSGEWLWICSAYYVVFDYVGYGIVQDEKHEASFNYRIAQIVLCWLPAYLLMGFEARSWSELHNFQPCWSMLSFFLLWWTFCFDWGYYGLTAQPYMKRLGRWLKARFGWPKMGWDDWKDTLSDFANGITHAWWTPLGLLVEIVDPKPTYDASGDRVHDLSIPPKALAFQSAVGLAFAIFFWTMEFSK